MQHITGGVCAAKGFKAAGIHVGVKTSNKDKKDLALIVADHVCNTAAVYTKNLVKAAPLHITQNHLKNGRARAVIVNSGNANACAPNGEKHALACCQKVADVMGIEVSDVLVSSTGVIGQELPAQVIIGGVDALVSKLSYEASDDAAASIMTTDLTMKQAAAEFLIGGKAVRIGGIAKGSGMIHPNMGTMLGFITTDCAISSDMIQQALVDSTNVSFNRISVDGDTSTNDMLCLMASGLAENPEIQSESEDYYTFVCALKSICIELAKMIAADGEGATHLITCVCRGAKSEEQAEVLSKSVISSTLVKAAMFGADANWGRVLCAMGYSGVSFDSDKVTVAFESKAGKVVVCENGRGVKFDENLAKTILQEFEIFIDIDIHQGDSSCVCWGCDITYDYIKINGDYRT